ncbi:MAG: hypothetical protein A3F13_05625 [Gammaproteobacteria bacterium RIFCSPHIGHO2_12_FULL_40_19]|nr:MAG: hypothetical protein A3F13_05625 [Gammaproteobacteria bacterium RIFCSPHIGHO2_12_FULL_40_19]
MQFIKARKDLIFAVNPLIILSGIFLFCFLSNVIFSAFYTFWFSTAITLFFIVTPFGNLRLAQPTEDLTLRLPLPQWLFCIVLLELALLGVYYGICFINGQAMPINTPMHAHLFSRTLSISLLQQGLFPWNLYAVIIVGMGVLAYRQDTNAYFSNLLKPLTQHDPQETLGLIVNTGVRRCTLFALSITLMFMTLLLISLVLKPKAHLAFGFQASALLTTLILLMLSYTDTVKRYVNHLFSHRISTALSFPVFCIALGIMIILLSMMASGLTAHTTLQQTPVLIMRWISFNPSTAWSIFSLMWWLCLTPLVCSFIVRVSKGYRIRDILLGVLVLPILIGLCFIYPNVINLSSFVFSETTDQLLSLLSFLILLPLLLNHATASSVILSYFPKDGVMKRRDTLPFFFKIAQFTIICLYFYLVVGINGLSLLIFAPNYLTVITLVIGLCAILKNIAFNK